MSFEAMFGLIEMGFVYSVALGIGIWQVVKMRRLIARDRADRAKKPNDSDRTTGARAGRADDNRD